MSMGRIYYGHFISLNGVRYDFDILAEGYSGTADEVTVSANPLTIKWEETDKLEPVQSSSATLELVSLTDRQFVGLYTVKVGEYRLDVYRDGGLYWSGCLDPEVCEEPYSKESKYYVSVTFSDFANLDRMRFDRSGFLTLRQIVSEALSKTGINTGSIMEHISMRPQSGVNDDILDYVSIAADNFYDEDGEPMTWRETLDETLRPFALRLIQKDGRPVIYDTNAISGLPPTPVKWMGDDSSYEVDGVYNDVKVTFSPYERKSLLSDGISEEDIPDESKGTTMLDKKAVGDEVGFYTYKSDTGSGSVVKNASAKFFKIDSVYSGDDCAGILWSAYPYTNFVNTPCPSKQEMLFKIADTAYVGNGGSNDYRLKVSLSLCFDVRYNPFEEDSPDNDEKGYDHLKNWANFAYVPVRILLRDESGNVTYHFSNGSVKNSNSFAHGAGNYRWIAGEGAWGDCWLCWYRGNRKSETGLGGWQTNKPIIGYYRGEKLPAQFDKMGSGEHIPLPPEPGWIEVQVGVGVDCYDYDSDSAWKLRDDLYPYVRWCLYKDLTVEITDKFGKSIDTKDEELTAWINKDAKEELKIDTVVGTMASPAPTARGQIVTTSGKAPIYTMYKAGVSARLEKLLCGTAYSLYADRNVKLSGTVSVLHGFGIYSEAQEPGTYMVVGETQNLKDDMSEIAMTRFEADNYEGIEYE